jgi:hypothetical protein
MSENSRGVLAGIGLTGALLFFAVLAFGGLIPVWVVIAMAVAVVAAIPLHSYGQARTRAKEQAWRENALSSPPRPESRLG